MWNISAEGLLLSYFMRFFFFSYRILDPVTKRKWQSEGRESESKRKWEGEKVDGEGRRVIDQGRCDVTWSLSHSSSWREKGSKIKTETESWIKWRNGNNVLSLWKSPLERRKYSEWNMLQIIRAKGMWRNGERKQLILVSESKIITQTTERNKRCEISGYYFS